MREYLRPWKLATLAGGLGILIAGARYFDTYDWDIGISLIMGVLAYLSAPWALRVVTSLQWKALPAALLADWITVDGSYTAYNAFVGHPVGNDLRRANFFASTFLYLICGLIWMPRMSFREALVELGEAVGLRRPAARRSREP